MEEKNLIHAKKKSNRWREFAAYSTLFLFLLIWQWNGMILPLWTGFDMGVQNMELFTAISPSFDYGSDLLLTPYPPLSFLYKGVVPALTGGYVTGLLQSVIINVISAFTRTVIIALSWENAKQKKQRVIAALITAMVIVEFRVERFSMQADLLVLVSTLLICRIYVSLVQPTPACLQKQRKTTYDSIVVGALLSVPWLIKFSYFAITLALVLILEVIFLSQKKYLESGVFVASLAVFSVVLWMLCGEKVQNLAYYIYTSLRWTSGYSEVFSLDFGYDNAFSVFLFALVFCALYAVLLLYFVCKNRTRAVAWFIIAPFIFLYFKESFVRSDSGHIAYFIPACRFFLCYFLYVLTLPEGENERSGVRDYQRVVPAVQWVCVGAVAILLVPYLSINYWMPNSTIYDDFLSDDAPMKNRDNYTAQIETDVSAVRLNPDQRMLYQDIMPYPNETLGMLSGEQTFFIAYDLLDRFKMNPLISLWENINSFSEKVATEHYYSEDAPDILLYRPEPLDDEYFIFRMGTMLRPIIENYLAETVDENGYLVLKHVDNNRVEAFRVGEEQSVTPGEEITVPEIENAHVFMQVDWDLSWAGKIAAFLLKPTKSEAEITLEDGETLGYRFFRPLAQNGVLVSSYVRDSWDLAEAINTGRTNHTIRSIRLQGNGFFYQKDMKISFYAVPVIQKPVNDLTFDRTEINLTFGSKIPAGAYQLFYAQEQKFEEMHSVWAYSESDSTNVYFSINRADWDSFRIDFPLGTAEYSLTSITIGGMEAVLDGANDIEIEKTESGWHIITGSYDPYMVFHGP